MPVQQTFGSSLPDVGVIINAVPGSPDVELKGKRLKHGQMPEAKQILVDAILEHTSTDSLEAATKHLEQEARLQPDQAETHLELAIVYGLIGKWDEAAAAGERATNLYSREPDGRRFLIFLVAALFIAGFAYASMGSLREEGDDARKVELAEESFSKALDLMPDNADSNYYLGALYRDLGRWEEAEEYFRKTIKIDPEYSMAYSDLGWIYLQHNKPKEALAAFEKAVQADPTNPIALRNLAQTHISFRHWDKAKEVLEQRIKIDPADTDAYDKLSALCFAQGEIDQAEEAAKKALEIAPNNAPAYFNLGMVYLEREQLTEAQREFRKTLSLDAGSALAEAAHNNLRVITAELQKREEEQRENEHPSGKWQPTGYEHVVLDGNGVPVIAGANMKVIELVNEKNAYGWSPEQMLLEHPYLTLGQIHSAFAYYADHEEELDEDIQRRLDKIEEIREAVGPSPLRARLEAKGLL